MSERLFSLIALIVITFSLPLSAQAENLDDRLERIRAEAQEQRLLLGGMMLGLSGAFVTATPISASIGNEYSTSMAPGYYGISAGLMALAGSWAFLVPTAYEASVQELSQGPPAVSAEAVRVREERAQRLLQSFGTRARIERISGGVALIAAGVSNYFWSLEQSFDTQRDKLQKSGFLWAGLGYMGALWDRRPLGMASLLALGLANCFTYVSSPNSPSQDYLTASGAIAASLGVFRLAIKRTPEIELREMESPRTAFFLQPHKGGLSLHLQRFF